MFLALCLVAGVVGVASGLISFREYVRDTGDDVKPMAWIVAGSISGALAAFGAVCFGRGSWSGTLAIAVLVIPVILGLLEAYLSCANPHRVKV